VIQSVDRAIRIMKALGGGTGRLGVSELSSRLGLAKGTVHGLLRTLQAHGLVEQHVDSDKYQLGPELLNLSNRYLDLNELRSRALAWSELLALRTQEAVRVTVLHGRGALVVHHVFRPDSSLQILEVGSVLPLHATALGKAAIAYLEDETVEELLADDLSRLTGHTLTGAAAVRRELEFVRTRGFAREREEAILGGGGLAAAIFARTGESVGAIGIAGPRARILRGGREPVLATHVIEAARGVSRDLGAPRWPAQA
jgi:DNA-binding IclR family transcriptional regulator